MLNNTLIYAAVSLLGSCLLLYVYIIGTIVKVRCTNSLSNVPSLFSGTIALFSVVYFLTMATLYFNGLAHLLHYIFLFSIGFVLYFARRTKITIFNREILENCAIFCGTIFIILLYQFYPFGHLTNNTPANNFLLDLPIDNTISLMFAESLLRGELMNFGDWLGSDRPPLFSGTILFLNIFHMSLAKVYLFIGIVAQAIIVPVVMEFVTGLSKRKLTILERLFIALIVISSPVFIHNVAFLWPKIFAAMFLIITVYLLFFQNENTTSITILTSISMLLSFLSHGGSAFAIIAMALIYIVKIRKKEDLYRGLLLGGVFIAGYLPWMFYQKVIQPPGDRLIKWHLLGQTDIVPEGVGHVFIEKYRDIHFLDIPIRTLKSFQNQIVNGFSYFMDAPSIQKFNEHSFFYFPFSVGVPVIVLAIILLFIKDKAFKTLMLIALVTTLVWFALPFRPVWSMHEGTYLLPILIISACAYGVLKLQSGKVVLMVTLSGFGITNMAVMDRHRMDLYNHTHLIPQDVYKLADITNYHGGADSSKTKAEIFSILGSHLTSDADTADFTLTATNGDGIYYQTGPDATGQTLEVYGDGKQILKLHEAKSRHWKRLNIGKFNQVQVRLVDLGKGWGQWSTIAVLK